MKTLEDKEQAALALAGDAAEVSGGSCALFDGGAAGVVLLHLLKRSSGGEVREPVLFVRSPDLSTGALKFADKLRRIWRLDMRIIGLAPKPDGARYTEEEMVAAASSASCGALILPWTGASPVEGAPGPTVHRPLAVFTEDDVSAYTEARGLPRSSEPPYGGGVPEQETQGEDDEAIGEKLRELGYM